MKHAKYNQFVEGKLVVNHELVQVIQDYNTLQYRVFIVMEKGGVIEHKSFPGNAMGVVGAMNLATECMAGKIWLQNVHSAAPGWTAPTELMLEGGPTDSLGRAVRK
jgi:hypothetical protein